MRYLKIQGKYSKGVFVNVKIFLHKSTLDQLKFFFEQLADDINFMFPRKIHILGSFQNIKIARTAICNLILGMFAYLNDSVTH